jgi:hypothetical protein
LCHQQNEVQYKGLIRSSVGDPKRRITLTQLVCVLTVAPLAQAQEVILQSGFEVVGDPPVAFAPTSDSEAARFLAQATFGPSISEIARLRSIGYSAWIDAELAKPFTSSISRLDPSRVTPGNNSTSDYSWQDMQNLMW